LELSLEAQEEIAVSSREDGSFHLQGKAQEKVSLSNHQNGSLNLGLGSETVQSGEELPLSEAESSFSDSSMMARLKADKPEILLDNPGDRKLSAEHQGVKNLGLEGLKMESAATSRSSASRSATGNGGLPISDDQLLEQIKDGLAHRLQDRRTVTIKLWPENLGKVDVRLVMRNHELAATFLVEQSEVKDAMLRKLDNLKDSLQMRGIEVKGIEVKVVSARSGSGPGMNTGERQMGNNFAGQYLQPGRGGFFGQSSRQSEYYRGGGQVMANRGTGLDEGRGSIVSPVNRQAVEKGLHILA
jgi:flagellar hook-length control protein FliK